MHAHATSAIPDGPMRHACRCAAHMDSGHLALSLQKCPSSPAAAVRLGATLIWCLPMQPPLPLLVSTPPLPSPPIPSPSPPLTLTPLPVHCMQQGRQDADSHAGMASADADPRLTAHRGVQSGADLGQDVRTGQFPQRQGYTGEGWGKVIVGGSKPGTCSAGSKLEQALHTCRVQRSCVKQYRRLPPVLPHLHLHPPFPTSAPLFTRKRTLPLLLCLFPPDAPQVTRK